MSDALTRLVGDGKASGKAIPLPDAFTAVMQDILDHGSSSFTMLNGRVTDVLRFNEQRIVGNGWNSWEEFTWDIITVLSERMGLIKENQFARWEVTDGFTSAVTPDPHHRFRLPGRSGISFTARDIETRRRWDENDQLYRELTPVIAFLDRVPHVDDRVRKLLLEAEEILVKELKLGVIPQPQPVPSGEMTRYRRTHPVATGTGYTQHKGVTEFFRSVFWNRYAEPGQWYTMDDIAAKYTELHPLEPEFRAGDAGAWRKSAPQMVEAGILESRRTTSPKRNGVYVKEFRIKTPDTPGWGSNATIVPVEVKDDPKG